MNMIKRFIALILPLLVITSTIATSVFAEPTDVNGTKYEKAVSVLTSLGILKGYSDGSIKPEDTITRAEFAAVMTRAIGAESAALITHEKTPFNDVPDNFWGTGYIKVAADSGIINGYGNGIFDPNAPVTYEQAVKMIVSALGYAPMAESKGGYPTGYLVVAADKKILKDANGTVGEPVKRGTVAILIYNALDVEMMEVKGYGSESNEYEVTDHTLLNSKLGIMKQCGQITANSNTSLDSGDISLEDDEVVIKTDSDTGITYKVGLTDAKKMLGYIVDFYAYKDKASDKPELFSVIQKAGKNKVITVDAENIDKEKSNLNTFYYWNDKEKNKYEDVKVSSFASIILNGKTVEDKKDKDICPDVGYVTLLDSDNDGSYDVIFVTRYQNFVVKSIDQSLGKIYFKQNNKYTDSVIELHPDDKDYKISIVKDGKEIAYTDLKEWDVATVAKSEDGKVVDIIVSSQSVTGKVDEIENHDNAGEYKISIDGKVYTVAADYGSNDIELNDKGTYYLNYLGKIVYNDEESLTTGDKYAYILRIAIKKGIENFVELKLLTGDNEQIVYRLNDKVTFTQGKESQQRVDAIDVYNKITNHIVIMYSLNKENKIDTLKTLADYTSEPNYKGYNEDVFSLDCTSEDAYFKVTNIPMVNAWDASGSKYSSYLLDDNTIIFNLPELLTEPDENFKAVRFSNLISDYHYSMDIIDANSKKVAKVIINRGKSTSNTSSLKTDCGMDKHIMVVDKLVKALKGDEVVCKLYGYQDGKPIELYTSDDYDSLYDLGDHYSIDEYKDTSGLIKFGDLKKGDIIQYNTDVDGTVNAFRVLFVPNSSRDVNGIQTWGRDPVDSTKLKTVIGLVQDINDKVITITTDEGITSSAYGLDGVYVYKIDIKNDKVTLATTNEIISLLTSSIDASRVFARINNDKLTDIVIIKK